MTIMQSEGNSVGSDECQSEWVVCGISLSPTINKDWGWEKRDSRRREISLARIKEGTRPDGIPAQTPPLQIEELLTNYGSEV